MSKLSLKRLKKLLEEEQKEIEVRDKNNKGLADYTKEEKKEVMVGLNLLNKKLKKVKKEQDISMDIVSAAKPVLSYLERKQKFIRSNYIMQEDIMTHGSKNYGYGRDVKENLKRSKRVSEAGEQLKLLIEL